MIRTVSLSSDGVCVNGGLFEYVFVASRIDNVTLCSCSGVKISDQHDIALGLEMSDPQRNCPHSMEINIFLF